MSGSKFTRSKNNERYYDMHADALRRIHKDQRVFYVDSNYSGDADNWSGRRLTAAKPTVKSAYDDTTAARGDTILVEPFHAETITAVVTLSNSYVQLEGVQVGNHRPVITGNGTIDVFSMEGQGQSIKNLKFAAPGTDAQTADINIAAADCLVENTMHLGSDTGVNKVDIITLTADADDVLIDGAYIYNTVVECPGGIAIEGALTNLEVSNCMVFDSIGFTGGCIHDEATATGLWIHHNQFMNAKAGTVVMEFGNNSTGNAAHNQITGRHTTIASNVTAGTGMNFFENYCVEEAALNGILIPVADAD